MVVLSAHLLDKRHDVPDFKLIKPTHKGFTNDSSGEAERDRNMSTEIANTATLARTRGLRSSPSDHNKPQHAGWDKTGINTAA
jgi:hypothetical protein